MTFDSIYGFVVLIYTFINIPISLHLYVHHVKHSTTSQYYNACKSHVT